MVTRMRFDELDRQIVHVLQGDGRASFAELARELGASEATIRARVARLLRSGAVKVVASVDALELGFTVAYIGVRVRGGALDRVLKAMRATPEVTYVVVCAGSFDLFVEVVCTDGPALMRLLDERIRQAPGVEYAETFTVLDIAKDEYQWPESGVSIPA
ncbi:MAG: Lrp/AsnC family transcriptional regulator [Actinomycetota bacterium]